MEELSSMKEKENGNPLEKFNPGPSGLVQAAKGLQQWLILILSASLPTGEMPHLLKQAMIRPLFENLH